MSRIGKKPVVLPQGMTAKMDGRSLTIELKGKKLSQFVDPRIAVEIDASPAQIRFSRSDDDASSRAMHGLYRALANNIVVGLTKGFSKTLEIVGIGYNAKLQGKDLVLQIGFCHPVTVKIPDGLTIETPKPTLMVIKGADRQLVGQFAAEVRGLRPPEPYKGKGIRYSDEVVRRKAGKALAAGGGG
ncbi:MAG: 50S ribosomal protein L6 [Gemmatimonadaceae bacterium]